MFSHQCQSSFKYHFAGLLLTGSLCANFTEIWINMELSWYQQLWKWRLQGFGRFVSATMSQNVNGYISVADWWRGVCRSANILTEAIEQNKSPTSGLPTELCRTEYFAQHVTRVYNIAYFNDKIPSIYSVDLRQLMNGQVREHLQVIPSDVI